MYGVVVNKHRLQQYLDDKQNRGYSRYVVVVDSDIDYKNSLYQLFVRYGNFSGYDNKTSTYINSTGGSRTELVRVIDGCQVMKPTLMGDNYNGS